MINGFSSELWYFCILSRTFICVNNVLHFLMKFIIKDAKWQKYGKKNNNSGEWGSSSLVSWEKTKLKMLTEVSVLNLLPNSQSKFQFWIQLSLLIKVSGILWLFEYTVEHILTAKAIHMCSCVCSCFSILITSSPSGNWSKSSSITYNQTMQIFS